MTGVWDVGLAAPLVDGAEQAMVYLSPEPPWHDAQARPHQLAGRPDIRHAPEHLFWVGREPFDLSGPAVRLHNGVPGPISRPLCANRPCHALIEGAPGHGGRARHEVTLADSLGADCREDHRADDVVDIHHIANPLATVRQDDGSEPQLLGRVQRPGPAERPIHNRGLDDRGGELPLADRFQHPGFQLQLGMRITLCRRGGRHVLPDHAVVRDVIHDEAAHVDKPTAAIGQATGHQGLQRVEVPGRVAPIIGEMEHNVRPVQRGAHGFGVREVQLADARACAVQARAGICAPDQARDLGAVLGKPLHQSSTDEASGAGDGDDGSGR